MVQNMTTTNSRFRVEDITFRNARKQSEVENEIEREEVQETEVKAPVSLTPEQVKDFFKTKIKNTSDSNERRLYSQMVKWVDELQSVKRELSTLREKEIARAELDADTSDTIDESSRT